MVPERLDAMICCLQTRWHATRACVSCESNQAAAPRKKISQEDLAANAGLSRNGIGLIEQGKRWPRLATLLKISDALGMTIEEVLKGIQRRKKRR
jgi:DNA-binding XRE family transcriptional regulator